MLIFAVDPGNKESGYVIYDTEERKLIDKGKVENVTLRQIIESRHEHWWHDADSKAFVCERVACYGMTAGASLFETAEMGGRFCQLALDSLNCEVWWMYRRNVKMELCGSTRAKDGNVTQAVKDRFNDHPELGGGKEPAKGTKSKPGPLYGCSGDIWQALALALAFEDRGGDEEVLP